MHTYLITVNIITFITRMAAHRFITCFSNLYSQNWIWYHTVTHQL